MAASAPVPVAGATEPGVGTPSDVARTQRQLKLVQWLNPLVTFAILASSAVHEEQQRPAEQLKGRLQKAVGSARSPKGAAVLAGVGLLAAARARRGGRSDGAVQSVEVVDEVTMVDLTDGSSVDVSLVEVVTATPGDQD
jgi:hypothetical protein